MSDPPLMDSSDCYATWSGPPTEDRGSVASKGKTVGFEKQNSVDQDMVRVNGDQKLKLSMCDKRFFATMPHFVHNSNNFLVFASSITNQVMNKTSYTHHDRISSLSSPSEPA